VRRLLVLCLLLAPTPAFAQSETIEYYGADMLGSIRIVWDANGNVVGRQDYVPFGRPLFTAPSMPTEAFTGQDRDDETDQGHFRARMFQARTGRFTQVDPIFSGLFQPQGWNRYAYAMNNPLILTDPSGLTPEEPCGMKQNPKTGDWEDTCKITSKAGSSPAADAASRGLFDWSPLDGLALGSISPGAFGRRDGRGVDRGTVQDPGSSGNGDQNPCEQFSDAIVTAITSDPDGLQAAGNTMVNLAYLNPWRLDQVSSESVKTELTQYGQRNGVFHHIAFTVGAAFSNPSLIGGLMFTDAVQAAFGRGESMTELRDDVAGIKVAAQVAGGLVTGNVGKAKQDIAATVCK
jgi:RHS repeat-associated protein